MHLDNCQGEGPASMLDGENENVFKDSLLKRRELNESDVLYIEVLNILLLNICYCKVASCH